MSFLLYGATGFVGSAIAAEAVRQGLNPVLGGRNGAAVAAVASRLGLEHRTFGLDRPVEIEAALGDVDAVFNCAGPFVRTFQPFVTACLRTGTHYLDVTGEIPVFETIATWNPEAKARGVMLLPGAGFDVVPTDCLAAHLKERLPSATQLRLALRTEGPASLPRGTAMTAIEMLPLRAVVRRDSWLFDVPFGFRSKDVDFGGGPVRTTLIPWGDVATAYRSTGIPNIEAFAAVPPLFAAIGSASHFLGPVLTAPAIKQVLRRFLQSRTSGPTVEERAATRTTIWGEVTNDRGGRASGDPFAPSICGDSFHQPGVFEHHSVSRA